MIQLSGIVKRILFIVYVTLKVERSSVLPIIFSLEILSHLQNKSFAPAYKQRLFSNFDFKMCEAKFGALGQILNEIPKGILKLFRKILKEMRGVYILPEKCPRLKEFGISAYVSKGSVYKLRALKEHFNVRDIPCLENLNFEG